MIDYHGFWLGFIAVFGIVPFFVGALGGLLWARNQGLRGCALLPAAFSGGAILSFGLLAGAVLFFRF